MASDVERVERARVDAERRIGRELRRRVVGWERLSGGGNNWLHRAETDGEPLVLKVYRRSRWLTGFYRRSGADGQTREWGALTLLRDRGVGSVPRPLLRSRRLGYAVYSLVPGVQVGAAELTVEAARRLGEWAAAAHAFGPGDVAVELPRAIGGSLSLADHANGARQRLAGVVAHLERNPRPDDPLRRALDGAGLTCTSPDDSSRRALVGTDFAGAIEEAIARATAGLSAEEIEAPLPRAAWRLNSGDFCVVNLLVDGEQVAVVDWEWAGWDDPANLAVGFLRHAGTEGLRPEAGTAFLEAYCAARGLPEEERVRFGQVARLQNAFWLAALAFAAAPETLAARRATVPDFDESAHVANIATRLRARLEAIARR